MFEYCVLQINFSGYQGLEEHRSPEMDSVLEQALKEAEDDVTFKKVKRMSYSSNAAGEVSKCKRLYTRNYFGKRNKNHESRYEKHHIVTGKVYRNTAKGRNVSNYNHKSKQ